MHEVEVEVVAEESRLEAVPRAMSRFSMLRCSVLDVDVLGVDALGVDALGVEVPVVDFTHGTRPSAC